MRIAVDGFNLALEKGTGVATYARNLTHCLHNLGNEVDVLYGTPTAGGKASLMKEIAFFDANPAAARGRLQRARRAVGAVLNPFATTAEPIVPSGAVIYRQFLSQLPYFDHLWNAPHMYEHGAFRFRLYRRRMTMSVPAKIDIAHWTYPLPVMIRQTANIYTLHDLVPLRLPYTTLDRKQEYYRLVTHLARQADHIVTVSETSKTDIMNLLGVPESKITNTYQSVSIPDSYLSVPQDILEEELRGAFRLQYKNYFLFHGSIEPKKNIGRIIEAYLASNVDIPLVIVGAQAWKSEQELKLLKLAPGSGQKENGSYANTSGGRVIQLDYVTFPQLVTLIRGALGVTFPSLYEGFGLPILEGMLCGTPVITSNIGSMQEVAGDAAVLVDPYNVRDIKTAIVAVARNAGLRAEKIARGAAVARRFSPEAYQKRLQELYARFKPSGGDPS